MKRITETAFLTAFTLILTGCTLVEVETDQGDKSSSSSSQVSFAQSESSEEVLETNNVSYTGIVQPAGISIYQEGSHRLVLDGGKFILLESDSLDLNGYVGENVQIDGALRPTVEAGGMIMRVERITLLQQEESSESSVEEESSDSSESSTSDLSESSIENVSSVSSEQSSVTTEPSSESSSSQEASSEESSTSSAEVSAEFTERVEVMSRQDYTASNWSQQYCTSHIGFCAPVHKNWWFKSFGATSSTLWHVEFSSEPIESLGEGPITLNLIAGSNELQDGEIEIVNDKAVAYKEWTFGRHFQISGDARLEEPIRYILNAITEYEQ